MTAIWAGLTIYGMRRIRHVSIAELIYPLARTKTSNLTTIFTVVGVAVAVQRSAKCFETSSQICLLTRIDHPTVRNLCGWL